MREMRSTGKSDAAGEEERLMKEALDLREINVKLKLESVH
jgi:hypothetical protein